MKHLRIYCVILCFFISFSFLSAEEPFVGIWENAQRFIALKAHPENPSTHLLKTVLKTYYRFVYEDMGEYAVSAEKDGQAENVYSLSVRYPQVKLPMVTRAWVHNNTLFTSFYKKTAHTVSNSTGDESKPLTPAQEKTEPVISSLEGFWIEQGHRSGILIYPQENPAFFDAFFFKGNAYIKFRYWKADLEYQEKGAIFVYDDMRIAVPKMFQHNGSVYSCITSNGSLLKNYERGWYRIEEADKQLHLTVTPEGGGPGSKAVGDVYPHAQYPRIEAVPLAYDEKDGVFAFGEPFLTRSSVLDLQEEITKHNSLKRPPPEPFFHIHEMDFQWERIKEIRKEK